MVRCLCEKRGRRYKKVVILAELSSRYTFKDKQGLIVNIKMDDQVLQYKKFDLETSVAVQQFVLEYENTTVPFDQVQVFSSLRVDPDNYYLSNWASEYNCKLSAKSHDVVLTVGTTKFYVMRSYLATWSHYFDRLFYGDFKEKNQKEIKIEDVDPEVFETILRLIHPTLARDISEHNVLDVLKLADRFEIPSIMARCGTLLCDFEKCKQLEMLDRLELADNHNLVHLQITCFERIHKMDANARTEFFDKNRRRIQNLSTNTLKNLL